MFSFKSIGRILSPYKKKSGMPIQGALSDSSKGKIEVFKEFEEGLKDIDGFSHLILIYCLDRNKDYKLVCKPFLDEEEHGVFAVRSPKRPNPIGISIVSLEKVEGNILFIGEVDVLDETPLLDIKPYVPQFDYRENVKAGWVDKKLPKRKMIISDDRFGA